VDVNRNPKGRCGRLRRKRYYALRVHVHGMRRAYNNREKAEKFAARQKRSPFVRNTKVEQTGRRSLTNYLVLRYTVSRELSGNPSGDLVFHGDRLGGNVLSRQDLIAHQLVRGVYERGKRHGFREDKAHACFGSSGFRQKISL
jgi:hypothetical protein